MSEDYINDLPEINIDEIVDDHGQVRRLGSLAPPAGFVSSYRTFEAEHPVLDDPDIKRLIIDPNRTPARILFEFKIWIQNQFDKGSCNGWAGATTYSKARFKRGLTDLLQFSGSFLYSLINGGRDQGSALEDGLREIQKTGCCPRDMNAWDKIFKNQISAEARAAAAKHKGLDAYAVQTKQGFRSALALGFPVIVAVHAGGRFQRLDASGIAGVDNGSGNHAIHCDDIKIINGHEVYDACNSWGLNYGDKGRAYLTWESFEQTFGHHTFYAIASTEEKE